MGPGDVPQQTPVRVVETPSDEPGETPIVIPEYQPPGDGQVKALGKLREQFPADMIEKLPKPTYRGAWDDQRGSHCDVCNGYHVLQNCIHLDYVGHANVTNRLLEVDPFWEWEPMAYTEAGTPLFSDGGLWIRLTVCGVTRIGYGDGKSVKEVIGDAIRNAAMRFGVGLDLWAKIDLHAERNPGDGETSRRQQLDGRGVREGVQRSDRRGGRDAGPARGAGAGGDDPQPDAAPPDAAPEAPNQDALDALGDVCDSEGIAREAVRELFAKWLARRRLPAVDILVADSQTIYDFAAHLLEVATDPGAADQPGAGDQSAASAEGGDAGAEDTQPGEGSDDGAEAASTDPLDTSDVEAQAGDLF